MQDIIDHYTMLAEKVGAEIPDLHMVLLLYNTPCWKEARRDAVRFLSSRYGEDADELIDHMMSGTGPDASVSMQYGSVIESGGEKTIVFQVNLDQARSVPDSGQDASAKAIISHEIAHVVGEHIGRPSCWDSCQEEALADMFSCAIMANAGHDDYEDSLVRYRLFSHVDEKAFAISSTIHGFPAVAEASRALARRYAERPKGALSIRELKQDVEKIVGDHLPLLIEWQKFANAVMDLQEEGHETGDILHLARKAGSSFVDLVEVHTPFRAAATLSKDFQKNPFEFGYCDNPPPEKIRHENANISGSTEREGYAVLHDQIVVSAPSKLRPL